MKDIIDVFRMEEINKKTRIKIIIQLGKSINNALGGNFTEGLVYELVSHLDPNHEILSNKFYRKAAGIES
jgi:hypothetical protein